jgi:intein/homing endonuclease
MIEIQLEMSKSIKLTPDHFVYVIRNSKLVYILGSEVKNGDKMINALEKKEVSIIGIKHYMAREEDTVALYSSTKKLIVNGILVSSISKGDVSDYWYEPAKLVSMFAPTIPHLVGEFVCKAT